jgi:hypothetical protein
MSRRQYCADNLFLLGEMLDMAAGYISLCDEVLNKEDKPMVELAYDHIHLLKKRTVKLGKELEELEPRVRNKLVRLGDPKASKKRAKTTCSASSVGIEFSRLRVVPTISAKVP